MVKYLSKPFFVSTLICIFVFYSGIFKIPEKNRMHSLFNESQICAIHGKIVSSPAKNPQKNMYLCNFKTSRVKDKKGFSGSSEGIIKLCIPSDMAESYIPGRLFSHAKEKGNYLYETGAECTFYGTFKKGIFYTEKCTFQSWNKTKISGKAAFLRAVSRLKFKRLMYTWGKAGGLLTALLSGSKEFTDVSLSDSFKTAGLSHILALSGMHLSMFSAIAVFIGSRLKRRKVMFAIRISTLIFFVWFAGFSPSLLRAFICSMISIAAAIAGSEEPDLILVLCFSFLFQCALRPSDIYNAGFILSYAALGGILLCSDFFCRLYSKIIPYFLSRSLASSTSAQIFTLPVSLKIFGSFSPIGIVATSVVSPFITVFIYSGLILILFSLIFPSAAGASGFLLNKEYNIINFLVALFAKAPVWSI